MNTTQTPEVNKGGRPTKRAAINKKISEAMREGNAEKVSKLKDAAALDASVGEMCYYAGISESTYFRWMKENPELQEEITRLRNKPVLKARQEVIKGLDNNPQFALAYLSKKRSSEFSEKSKVEHSGGIASAPTDPEEAQAEDQVRRTAEEGLRNIMIGKRKPSPDKQPLP